MKPLRWIDDDVVLNELQLRGVAVENIMVPVAKIDLVGSTDENARPGRELDKDQVEKLALQMISDEPVFKRIFVRMKSNGLFAVDGGVHRVHAALMAGVKELGAHKFDSDDELLLEIIRNGLNDFEGMTNPLAVRRANAKHLVERFKMSEEEAATTYRIKPQDFRTWLEVERLQDVFHSRGVPVQHLTHAHFYKLRSLSDNYTVMCSAGALSNKARMSSTDLIELVKEIRAEKGGEEQRLAVIAKWDQRLKGRLTVSREGKNERKVLQRPRFAKFALAVKRLDAVMQEFKPTKAEHLQITRAADLAEINEMMGRIHGYWTSIIRAAQQAQPSEDDHGRRVSGRKKAAGRR